MEADLLGWPLFLECCNLATKMVCPPVDKIFHCILDHKPQIKKWEEWGQDKRKAVLEHLRTGAFCPVLEAELESWAPQDLLDTWHASHLRGTDWDKTHHDSSLSRLPSGTA